MGDLSKRIPFAQLKEMPEFLRLTPKQQLFVAHYCESGLADGRYDQTAATQAAYQCKSPEVARIMAYSLMANMRIIEVLNIHFNAEPVEDFLKLVDRAIMNKKLTLAQVQALQLKCDVLGLSHKLPGRPGRTLGVIPESVTNPNKKRKKPGPKPAKKPAPTPVPVVSSEYGFGK